MSEDSRPRSTDRPRRASRPAVTGARGVGWPVEACRQLAHVLQARALDDRRADERCSRWAHTANSGGTRCIGGSHLVRVALELPRWCWRWRLAWLAPAPRGVWSSSPRSPDKRRGNRGLRGPRADNRSARLPQLIAVSGRRAGVIGLKRRRMSRHAVPCGRADSDLTPIGRRHGGRRTTGVARNADSVRGQASVRALVPTGVAAHLPALRGDAPPRYHAHSGTSPAVVVCAPRQDCGHNVHRIAFQTMGLLPTLAPLERVDAVGINTARPAPRLEPQRKAGLCRRGMARAQSRPLPTTSR